MVLFGSWGLKRSDVRQLQANGREMAATSRPTAAAVLMRRGEGFRSVANTSHERIVRLNGSAVRRFAIPSSVQRIASACDGTGCQHHRTNKTRKGPKAPTSLVVFAGRPVDDSAAGGRHGATGRPRRFDRPRSSA